MSVLQLDGLTRHFGGLRAVEEVTLDVGEHDFLGIIGPNGAGKTTLFSLVSGQLSPTAGRVVFDGTDITGWPAHRVAQAGLVRTFQLMRPFGSMSVVDNVAVASHTRHRSRTVARGHALEVLRRVRLDDVASATPAASPPPASSASSSRGHWRWSRGCCCSTRCSPGWCRPSASR